MVGWSHLTLNGVEVPTADLSWQPEPVPSVPAPLACSFDVSLQIRKGALSSLFASLPVLRPYWIFHQWKHVQRNCAPGGHRNSKVSRRIARALQEAR